MKKNKSNNFNEPKNPLSSTTGNKSTINESTQNVNVKDKINIVLGDKVKEYENILKMKKEQNNQVQIQIQNLVEKSNELISKRNKILIGINQQKSNIFVLKNKNKAYRNYLSDLTSKKASDLAKNKKENDTFNSIAILSENISCNINNINNILKENKDKLNLNENDLLKNIPSDFLKNLVNKNTGNK